MIQVAEKIIPSEDPRLDWSPQHDVRSFNFSVRDAIGSVEIQPKSWKTGPVLDQGREGACVGFGWTAELLASPKPLYDIETDEANDFAREYYYHCKEIDEWPGEDYDGTSVLAGAKVALEDNFVGEYRWCFGIEDVRAAVIAEGPVVIGIPWYSGMYRTRPSGLVEVGGSLVGGHCILITGYHPSMRIRGEEWDKRFEVFRWRNSWGPKYGVNGNGYIRLSDLRELLKNWGEACAPMKRKQVKI